MTYLFFYKPYKSPAWQDCSPACIDRTLQKIMMLPQIGLETKVYGFISSSINPLTTKLGRIVDQILLE